MKRRENQRRSRSRKKLKLAAACHLIRLFDLPPELLVIVWSFAGGRWPLKWFCKNIRSICQASARLTAEAWPRRFSLSSRSRPPPWRKLIHVQFTHLRLMRGPIRRAWSSASLRELRLIAVNLDHRNPLPLNSTPQLEIFTLNSMRVFKTTFQELGCLTKLQHFALSHVRNLSSALLQQHTLPSLRQLRVSPNFSQLREGVRGLSHFCPYLTCLDISACDNFTNADLHWLAKAVPKLVTLSCADTEITSLTPLCGLANLAHLEVSDCPLGFHFNHLPPKLESVVTTSPCLGAAAVRLPRLTQAELAYPAILHRPWASAPHLVWLDITPARDIVPRYFRGFLRSLTSLEYLRIWTGIKPGTLPTLGFLPCLQDLCCMVNNEDAVSRSEMLGLSRSRSLRCVELCAERSTEEGVPIPVPADDVQAEFRRLCPGTRLKIS